MRIRFAQAFAMTRAIRLSILLLLVPIATFSQSGVWGLRGISERFLIDGNLVISVDGAGFSVYDVSVPGAVHRLSLIETDGESMDGSIAGDDLFIATRTAIERYTVHADGTVIQTMHVPMTGVTTIAWNGGLLAFGSANAIMIWGLAGDGSLTSTGEYPINNPVRTMAWKGDDLFVALTDPGIRVIDGNTARDIIFIPEASRGFVISGNILYSASGADGVALIDISDPTAPAETGRTLSGILNLQNITVAGTSVFAEEPPKTIHLIDASSVTSPHEVAILTEPAQVMAGSGGRLFVSGPNLTSYGDVADSGNPLRVFDIGNLAAPHLSAEVIGNLTGPVAGVATDGTLAYVSDPPYFRVLDISTTQAPREIASLQIDGIQPHVKSLGTQAVLYGTGDVQLIDVSNPYHPRLVKTFQSLGHTPSTAGFVDTGIVEGNSFTGFHLVDFVDTPQPVIVAGIKVHPFDLVANGGPYAYVSLGSSGFGVFGFPSPNTAVNLRVNQIAVAGMAFAPATNDHPDTLIIRGIDGIHVFTLADPANPVDMSIIQFAPSGPLAASGNSVWIGSASAMTSMDITKLGQPFLETTSMHVVAPQQIAAANAKVVVADRYGIRVFGPQTAAPPPPPVARRRAATSQ
jgi:hypothetical protein